MKIFKKLKAYKEEEAKETTFGFGILKAMDYDKGQRGHLVLLSLNVRYLLFLKKIFIPL